MADIYSVNLQAFVSMYTQVSKFYYGMWSTGIPVSISPKSNVAWADVNTTVNVWRDDYRSEFVNFFKSIVDNWNNSIVNGFLPNYVATKDTFLKDTTSKSNLDSLIGSVSVLDKIFSAFSQTAIDFIVKFDEISGNLPDPGAIPPGSIYQMFGDVKDAVDQCTAQFNATLITNKTPLTLGLVTINVQTSAGILPLNCGVVGSPANIASAVAKDANITAKLKTLNNLCSRALLVDPTAVYDWVRCFYLHGLSTPLGEPLGDLILGIRTPLALIMDVIENTSKNISNIHIALINYRDKQIGFDFKNNLNIAEMLTAKTWQTLLSYAQYVDGLQIQYDSNAVSIS